MFIVGFSVMFAPQIADAQAQSIVPDRAFYLGLGGSFSGIDFGRQDVYAVGTSEIFEDGVLVATGEADGPGDFLLDDQTTFAPTVQGGYFQRIPGGDWLWGGKFTYAYLDSSSSLNDVRLPQSGSYTEDGVTTPFEGNAIVKTYTTSIRHQMALVPFVGRTFERSFVYLGAGPTLSQTKTEIDGLVGFADIGRPRDISGAPQDFSSTDWVYGAAATLGVTYFFDPSWFADVSYTYAQTQDNKSSYSSTFEGPGPDGTTLEGTLDGSSSGRVITQSVAFTMNWAF
jgi:opacity protein-like surface antigen